MSKPYVCLTCRSNLLLLSRPRVSRQQLRKPSTTSHINTHSQAEHDISTILNSGSPASNRAAPRHRIPRLYRDGDNSDPVREKKIGRYSRKELKPEELLGRLDKSWTSVGHELDQQSKTPGSRRSPVAFDSVQRNGPRAAKQVIQSTKFLPFKLDSFIEQFRTLDASNISRAWLMLQDVVKATSGRRVASRHLSDHESYNYVHSLIRELRLWWIRSLRIPEPQHKPPTPTEAIALLQELGLWQTRGWSFVLANTAIAVFELNTHSNGIIDSEKARESIEELIRIWYMCITAEPTPNSLFPGQQIAAVERGTRFEPTQFSWDFLPSPETIKLWTADEQPGMKFENILQKIGQRRSAISSSDKDMKSFADIASPTLLLLDMLRALPKGETVKAKYVPLLSFLDNLLEESSPVPVPSALVRRTASLRHPKLVTYYSGAFERLDLDTTGIIYPQTRASEGEIKRSVSSVSESNDKEPSAAKAEQSPLQKFTFTAISRIDRANQKQDLHMLDKIRREVSAFAGSQTGRGSTLPLELYESLMGAYLSLRNSQSAIEIWNQILQSGYRPTVKTYTTMMRGAMSSRDLSGMQAFWTRMHQASILPDVHAWSVRIFGLIKMKQVRAGLQEMANMGNAWVDAARRKFLDGSSKSPQISGAASRISIAELVKNYPDHIDGIPRPNIAIVNSAISALAMVAENEIPRVLSWGRSFGIEPDLRTYNALLNVAMRHSDKDSAFNILHRMQLQGIDADTTTWTVLLTALFEGEFLSGLNQAEQQETILEFLASLENGEQGMPGVDVKGYALIIDRLLKQYDNSAAAEAVLTRMIDSGQQPTMHIYTILVTSYFQKQPIPDFAAVEALWRRISSENDGYGAALDSVFFDRVIEGYAQHHRVAGIKPMLGFLERMQQEGKLPGWKALEGVARALAERQEWDRLRGIVLDVRKRLESSRGTIHRGQREFWDFVLSTGLLEDEDITRAEQFLRGPNTSPLVQGHSV